MFRGEEKTRSAWLRRWGGVILFALMGTLPLSSCTTAQLAYAVISAPTAKDKAEAQALVESLCKDAGTHIHRTVDDVEGFEFIEIVDYNNGRDKAYTDIVNGGCRFSCVEYLAQGYGYIEVELRTQPRVSEKYDFAEKVGRYRYRLVTRPHPSCERYDRVLQMNHFLRVATERNSERLQGKCIEAAPVIGVQSRYIFEGYFTEPASHPSLSRKQAVSLSGSRVLDRETREEVALAFSYGFYDGRFVGGNQASCGPNRRLDITDVLKPRRQ